MVSVYPEPIGDRDVTALNQLPPESTATLRSNGDELDKAPVTTLVLPALAGRVRFVPDNKPEVWVLTGRARLFPGPRIAIVAAAPGGVDDASRTVNVAGVVALVGVTE